MRSRRTTSLLIAGFLAFQLLYPIRGLVEEKFDTWGEFSWNMYSQTYDCLTRYQMVTPSGQRVELDLKPYFSDQRKIGPLINQTTIVPKAMAKATELPVQRVLARASFSKTCA